MPVVDASVWVALSNAGEPDHARCRAWLAGAVGAGEPLLAPTLLLAEVGAALARATGDDALSMQVVGHARDSGLLQLVPLTAELAHRAAHVAITHRLRGADAVYVAVALERGEPLVTLDRQQLERGQAAIPTRSP